MTPIEIVPSIDNDWEDGMSKDKLGQEKKNINDYYAGKGCQCQAYDQSECGCGVDWTPKEVYVLRRQRNILIKAVEKHHELCPLGKSSIPKSILRNALLEVKREIWQGTGAYNPVRVKVRSIKKGKPGMPGPDDYEMDAEDFMDTVMPEGE